MKGKAYTQLAAMFFAAGIGQRFSGVELADLVLFQAVNVMFYGLGVVFLLAFILANEPGRG